MTESDFRPWTSCVGVVEANGDPAATLHLEIFKSGGCPSILDRRRGSCESATDRIGIARHRSPLASILTFRKVF